ncbi:molybdopterin dinucleotide binding domain-containing protein [Mesorhizobium captivum]|uniref:molybdopterin dinucleotide binding domain-containing protein n=1 Tax=Mesorhizobium captivum TaxID=3072319 RepID=UPI002A24B5DD|nr:molybdopterin dinucleotide binding domain-containing protein [Mesorhizobium sp. VK3C]MDX8449953.1 molybdopterin dinucleotide binding domain-containing protein [Mesorhizobium sp. VK3C]
MKPALTDHIEINKYEHPTGGWGSLRSLIRNARGEGLLVSGIWSTLLKQNKADGYMCVSCWETPNKKANFKLPTMLEANPDIDLSGDNVLTLITVRSNDQFNTTVYGYDDRLRGIHGTRMVLLINEADIQRFGLSSGQEIDLETHADDSVERCVRGLRVTPYSIPEGNCAGYYPELNPLVPLWHRAKKAHVPAAKSVSPGEPGRSGLL